MGLLIFLSFVGLVALVVIIWGMERYSFLEIRFLGFQRTLSI